MMSKSEAFLLFLAAVFLSIAPAFGDGSWDHHLQLDHEGAFHVYWTPKENRIVFKVEVATKGYVGFGLSPHGRMAGSDIVTGWVADEKPYFQDRHGVGNAFPPKDKHQDWVLSRGWENDTHTSLIFYRDLVTCDPDDMDIDEGTVRLIYAYSNTDPISEYSLDYHGSNRGTHSVFLLQRKMDHLKNVEGLPYWDVKAPNFTLTSKDRGKYWSTIIKRPQLKAKHHIIQVEPLIQPKNVLYVHHLNIFECIQGVPEELERYVNQPFHFPNKTFPQSLYRCQMLLVGWNVGGNGILLPDEAGFPLPSNTTEYYRLEIHYDNEFLHDNIRDESGLRLYHTNKLRKYDAGILGIAALPESTLIIPPHQNEFIVAAHSSQECMRKKMPEKGIKFWGLQLHAHNLGRRIRLRHFRGNKELPPVIDDHNYDFGFQDYRYLQKEVHVLPTDQLTLECFYNSSGKSNTTFGGENTSDEMCDTFILYYPRITTSKSFSGLPFAFVADLVRTSENGMKNASGTSEATPISNLKNYVKSIDWNSRNVSQIKYAMRFSPQEIMCFPGLHGKFEEMKDMVSFPEDLVPYNEKTSKCIRSPKRERSFLDTTR